MDEYVRDAGEERTSDTVGSLSTLIQQTNHGYNGPARRSRKVEKPHLVSSILMSLGILLMLLSLLVASGIGAMAVLTRFHVIWVFVWATLGGFLQGLLLYGAGVAIRELQRIRLAVER